MTELQDTIRLLADLVAYPTVSADSNLAMVAALAERLKAAGARVEVLADPTGKKANLVATLGPDRPGGILLSGHTDVVPAPPEGWSADPFAMIERDGRLYGRGTCDMKGFIAAAVTLAPAFAAAVRERPLHFSFTYDEEPGCLGARALAPVLAEKGIRPRVAIVGEPTGMRVIEGHKGCWEYTAHFEGLAGHGSEPGKGVNAVEYAVRYVARLLELRADLVARTPPGSRFDPPFTTINPGALHGGVAHNVIADRASVNWEMRPVVEADGLFVRGEMRRFVEERLLPEMQAVWPGARIETEVIGEVAGLEPADENLARDIVMELTGANSCDLVAFSTEAGIFQGLGMDVVVCGPGSIAQAHKIDEFLAIDQLEACLGMLKGLAARLAG